MRRIILTTGGTGGHIFPAIAVAEQIRNLYPEAELLFIGSNYGPEKKFAENAGLEFVGLNVRGVMGRGIKAVNALMRLGLAIPQAMRIIKKFNPDRIAGFGGYASFAPILAGHFCNIPILLHEQNAIPGSCNRLLSRYARKICISLPHTTGFDEQKCILTGNPVRSAISGIKDARHEESGRRPSRLLVLGGSQGAHALNIYVQSILDELHASNIEIIHQTGSKDREEVSRAYAKHGYSPECARDFIDDMANAYAWADIVLCRSGASTVAEICAAGLPAVFVPFPGAIHDHQTKNAEVLEKSGACRMVPEDKIENVGSIILNLLDNPGKLENMSRNVLKLARPNAARDVAKILESFAS